MSNHFLELGATGGVMSMGGPDEGQGRGISRGLGGSTSTVVPSTDTFACSFPPPGGRQKDTSTTLSVDRVNDSSTHLSTRMVCDDEDGDEQGASAACSSSATGPRQVSFHASSSSAMSGAGLTPSGSVGSYTSGAGGVGCCGGMTDVTSSFLSMSPCSAAAKFTDAPSGMSIPGWSPVSVTSTSNRPTSASSVGPTQPTSITSNWRDKNSNSNKRSGGSGSDGSGRDAAGAYGRLRSNRKRRSLHRQPPSKCLSTLAAEVSILESDGDDHPYGGNDSDTDNSDGESFSFPGTTNTTSTWDNHHDHAGSLSSGYCGYDDGRANSFNTRPYKRQPSSCEWDHHGSTALALGGSRRVSTSTRCSSGNVSGANTTDGGGSTSPCFSQASSNGEHSGATNSAAMSPLLLSQSAPSGLVGEWGQFVDVISTDESNKKARPPQPLAFSPGLGGGSCIVGTAPSPSATIRAAADTSTNLPYFPKSRRRSSGGRAPPRRRASSVGSHHDNTIPVGAGTTGSPRRRFALTPRSASRVVGKVRSSSLFLEDVSVRSHKSAGGSSPPPPSPSLGPLSLRQGAFPSGQDAVSEQSIMQRPSLDDVSFAMDKMQV